MASFELDDVDRGILRMLQVDARNHSPSQIADAIGVAPNTVRNRLERMEQAGVIEGYVPLIDYEVAGFQLRVLFIGDVPVSRRSELAEEALRIPGVIEVVEVLSGRENLAVEVVGRDSDDITEIAKRLEEVGIQIGDEWFIKNSRHNPFDHFEQPSDT